MARMQKASGTRNHIQGKILIVCGPTATGKTKLAVSLAKRFNGELINADSRQMYKGLTIISGKDIGGSSPTFQKEVTIKGETYPLVTYVIDGIPVWLYDVAEPTQPLSISHFKELSELVIHNVIRRGKLPILVGGTGFYLSTFTHDIETLAIPSDTKLRTHLTTQSVEDLQRELQTYDPKRWERMNHSDRQNPRRLIRAIEVAAWKETHTVLTGRVTKFDTLWIGLRLGEQTRSKKINERVRERFHGGAVEEVRATVSQSGLLPSQSAIGLSVLRRYIDGSIGEDEAITLWTSKEVRYAKRQMTWFKKQKNITWFESSPPSEEVIEKVVRLWYTT